MTYTFRKHDYNVIQAETDADYLIATTAINIANNETVVIVGEDVDLLVLLVALTSEENTVNFLKAKRLNQKEEMLYCISEVQKEPTI